MEGGSSRQQTHGSHAVVFKNLSSHTHWYQKRPYILEAALSLVSCSPQPPGNSLLPLSYGPLVIMNQASNFNTRNRTRTHA